MVIDNRPRTIEIIKALLPKGIIWRPRLGSDLEKLYETIGDIFDEIVSDAAALRTLRIPLKTRWLDDLEREYGFTPPEKFGSKTDAEYEQERRQYIDALAFSTRGNASKDYIQARLIRAGFPVTVSMNQNPVRNPADFLGTGYKMACIDQDTVDISAGNSYCKHPDAVCGYNGGELFVDGVNDYNDLVPEDPERWNFVFFVGGATIGGLLLNDWDMELPHTDFWPANSLTYRVKDTTTKNTGNQSLLVRDQLNREEQELFPDTNDASLVAAFRMYDLQQDLGNNKTVDFEPFLEDYDMTDAGVDLWPSFGGATRSKTSSYSVSPVISAQNLLVEPTEAWNSGVRRNGLVVGTEYRLCMWLRVKDDILPAVVNGDQILYDSTGNGNSTLTWVDIDVTFVAESEYLDFVASNGHDFLEGFQIDEVVLHKTIQDDILLDADMELSGVDNWEAIGGATIGKGAYYQYFGLQCMGFAYSEGDGVRQSCLTIGKSYYVCAYIAVYAGSGDFLIECGGTIVASVEGISTYTKIDGQFVATSTNLDFVCDDITGEAPFAVIDHILLVEINLNEVKNLAPVNLFTDGDMEKTGTTDWTGVNSPTLSKVADYYVGSQCLKVEHNGTINPGVKQDLETEIGKSYLIVCASKGDGVCARNITIGSSVVKQWDDSATWDLAVVPYMETVDNNEIHFLSEATVAGQYSLFDNIKVIPLLDAFSVQPHLPYTFNRLLDGDCEQPDTRFWTQVNNSAVSKVTDVYYTGNQSMGVAYVDTAQYGVKQERLVIGKQYYLSGRVKLATTGSVIVVKNGASDQLWSGVSTTTEWQNVELIFTATATDILIQAISSVQTFYVDAFSCIEVDPINENAVNEVLPSGRSLDFLNDNDEHVDCNIIGSQLDDHWTFEFVGTIETIGSLGSILSRSQGSSIQWLIYLDGSGHIVVEGTSGSVTSNGSVFDSISNGKGPRHVVVTHDTTDTRIYIDGELDNTGTITCTAI